MCITHVENTCTEAQKENKDKKEWILVLLMNNENISGKILDIF